MFSMKIRKRLRIRGRLTRLRIRGRLTRLRNWGRITKVKTTTTVSSINLKISRQITTKIFPWSNRQGFFQLGFMKCRVTLIYKHFVILTYYWLCYSKHRHTRRHFYIICNLFFFRTMVLDRPMLAKIISSMTLKTPNPTLTPKWWRAVPSPASLHFSISI